METHFIQSIAHPPRRLFHGGGWLEGRICCPQGSTATVTTEGLMVSRSLDPSVSVCPPTESCLMHFLSLDIWESWQLHSIHFSPGKYCHLSTFRQAFFLTFFFIYIYSFIRSIISPVLPEDTNRRWLWFNDLLYTLLPNAEPRGRFSLPLNHSKGASLSTPGSLYTLTI